MSQLEPLIITVAGVEFSLRFNLTAVKQLNERLGRNVLTQGLWDSAEEFDIEALCVALELASGGKKDAAWFEQNIDSRELAIPTVAVVGALGGGARPTKERESEDGSTPGPSPESSSA